MVCWNNKMKCNVGPLFLSLFIWNIYVANHLACQKESKVLLGLGKLNNVDTFTFEAVSVHDIPKALNPFSCSCTCAKLHCLNPESNLLVTHQCIFTLWQV